MRLRPPAFTFIRRAPSTAGTRAFTLLELLIVVGLIGVLVGGVSLALGDSSGRSLATAQQQLASLVGQARANAAIGQTETRLLFYGNPPPVGEATRFLRQVQLVRALTPGSATTAWEPIGPALTLPRGIYLVPPTTAGFIAAGVVWPTNPAPRSTLNTRINYTLVSGNTPLIPIFGSSYWIEFQPNGSLRSDAALLAGQPYPKLAIATATLSATNSPLFNNPGAVRGLIIRPATGAVTYVNEAASF
ncbi:MAG: prepilin-type N-terminal cleavage/methylation domain-containing protein [Opitutaceae bacterium]|nr:prepilin-type N-terminal cleavage/methylation domain-containing protein [Opitutaceae bacterium]